MQRRLLYLLPRCLAQVKRERRRASARVKRWLAAAMTSVLTSVVTSAVTSGGGADGSDGSDASDGDSEDSDGVTLRPGVILASCEG